MDKIINLISTICPITGNALIDTILFAIITTISFSAAWFLTGGFADATGIYDSDCMSAIHWIIRIAFFLFLLSLAIGVINLIHWFNSWPWWGYVIFVISLAHIIAGISVIIILMRKKARKEALDDD